MKLTRGKIFAISYIVIVITLLFRLPVSYFKDSSDVSHVIRQEDLMIKVVQHDLVGEISEEQQGIYIIPGSVIDRTYYAENIGSEPVWIRVRISTSIDDPALSPDVLDLVLNLTDWTYADGFYYYNEILQPGETSAKLYSQVKIAGEVDNSYMGRTLTMEVYTAAVQSYQNDAGGVLGAVGWPEEQK